MDFGLKSDLPYGLPILMHPIPCKVVNGHTKYAFLYGSGDPIGSVPLLLMGETMRLREKATWIIPLSQKPPNKTS